MEGQNQISHCFYRHPFHILHFLIRISDKKKEKWKIRSYPFHLFRFSNIFLFLQLLSFAVQPVSSQDWDGVIVTQADYQSLQAFKHELIDTRGFLRSWNDSGYGACSGGWVGIKCAQGQVIVIQLPWKGLGGQITEKIGQLQALRKLSLHDNLITGSVPSSLGFLPNLRGVQLFNNRLSGSIPPSLGSSPLLQTLDLGNNSLTGTIPAGLANSTKLFRLNVSFNSLYGSIPSSLTSSPSLVFLAFHYNNLSGPIPDSWGGSGNSLFKLQSLTLDHNFFSGTIPASFGKLSELNELSLSHNQLSGTIPSEIGKLSRLATLDLSNNAINGSLPITLSNLSSLVVLNLESNNLDNQIPETLDKLHNLSVLNLRENHFSGHIPDTIGNISTLTQLDLARNNLSGGIPASIGDLPNLNSFNVSYNNLSGPVPTPLSRKFNSSSFVGNIQLCGYSGSAPCPSITPSQGNRAPSSEKKHGRKLSTKDVILIAAGALLVVLLLVCCILLCCLFRKRAASKAKDDEAAGRAGAGAVAARGQKGVPPVGGEAEAGGGETGGKLVHFDGPMVFTADDLLCATAEIMGKSTYGTVYKATLEDGSQVAVKRLREKVTKSQREFEAEVNVLGRIRHPNLLALRAYYLGPKGEKLLVFDYMPKGSLANFLHAREPDTTIDWPTRMRIAQGMTRGLFHLHTNETIIHGNLTSSNILLDEHTNAKIADFGLSRLMTAAANSNVIATAGALGYRAPELSKLKKANTKTDVYSLGVIILELLTGKSPGEAMNGADLPQWVASIVKEEWTNEVFDLELMRDASTIGDELLNTLKLALHCVDPSPSTRPEVQQVLQQLEEIRPEIATSSGDDGAGIPSTSD
ncbi:probably inactive leucine-rich repeat receptor-like protein kinase IMK2 [Cornus florida]|uniref:probably inactive leucine-rich repeat receptor-like protein kinase IMK2 n=1 Tax=Cornus florida TaxID=4283 RepID=UPI0028994591|nr:probably inactive leucine-rich repeat receptor-like protein kinase IMK2 [Cornus florida]